MTKVNCLQKQIDRWRPFLSAILDIVGLTKPIFELEPEIYRSNQNMNFGSNPDINDKCRASTSANL